MSSEKITPVHPPQNSERNLAVMGGSSFEKREKMLALREQLLAVEEDRAAGEQGCSIRELDAFLGAAMEDGKRYGGEAHLGGNA